MMTHGQRADHVVDAAKQILTEVPDPVVAYRLKRDVLGYTPDALYDDRAKFDHNPGVQILTAEQHLDGSWGRFHSRDSNARQRILTTEMAVDRGLALGLDTSQPCFVRLVDYLVQLIHGYIEFPDRPERNDRWTTGVQLFTAATLAKLKPNHPCLDQTWALWAEIAERTFSRGSYDGAADVAAHQELTGASVANSYLVLNNKYALTLLSARSDELPYELSEKLLAWLWNHPTGIRYLRGIPAEPPLAGPAGYIEPWFATQELLARFPAWSAVAGSIIDWLWAQRGDDGYWDFGSRQAQSSYFPLSANWRRPIYRKYDWSTRVLTLLAIYEKLI